MDLGSASGSGNIPQPPPVLGDRSGSSNDSAGAYPKLRVRIHSSDDLEIHPDIVDGSPSSEEDPLLHPEIIEDDADPVFPSTARSKHEGDPPPDVILHEDGQLLPTIRLGSSPSSASSSSSASSASSIDLFLGITEQSVDPEKPSEDAQPGLKVSKNAVPDGNDSSRLEANENFSIGSTSVTPVSDVVTHESAVPSLSPKQSPAIQFMDRSGEYDASRIPSSIFDISSATPQEWSAASNESLFSIHVGNASFSRDQSLKSGDLSKSGELMNSGEYFDYNPPLPVEATTAQNHPMFTEVKTQKQTVETEKIGATGTADGIVRGTAKAAVEDQSEEKKTAPSDTSKSKSISNLSDASGDSAYSFAFPVERKKKKKKWCACPSCYCSNCSWAFCYSKWLTCYCSSCSRPTCYCSNRSWSCCYCSSCRCAFCYHWNCSLKRWC